MKTPQEWCLEIEADIAGLPMEFRLEHIRETFVTMLEGTGYDMARFQDSDTTASLFILVAEIDRRLAAIRDRVAGRGDAQRAAR